MALQHANTDSATTRCQIKGNNNHEPETETRPTTLMPHTNTLRLRPHCKPLFRQNPHLRSSTTRCTHSCQIFAESTMTNVFPPEQTCTHRPGNGPRAHLISKRHSASTVTCRGRFPAGFTRLRHPGRATLHFSSSYLRART